MVILNLTVGIRTCTLKYEVSTYEANLSTYEEK